MAAIGLSGGVLHVVSNADLISYGVSQNPKIKILHNKWNIPKHATYDDQKELGILMSIPRVSLIKDVIKEDDSKATVISFTSIEHGYFMYNYLKEQLPYLEIAIIHGTSEDREYNIEQFNKGKIDILLSSMILKRGANLPIIERLFIGQGGKSKITVKQYTGRGLRHDGIHDEVLVYDMYDDGSYLSDHSLKRIRIYKGEGFDIEYMYPNTKGAPI